MLQDLHFLLGQKIAKDVHKINQRMDDGNLWNGRVFDCNYRGDYVANVQVKIDVTQELKYRYIHESRPNELTDIKFSVCQKS